MGFSIKKKESTKHILLKYSELISPPEGTIQAHKNIIQEKGYVWMGKFGKPLGKPMLMTLNKQIESNDPAYIFMTKKFEGNYIVYAAILEDVRTKDIEIDCVPKYYAEKQFLARTWFKITEFIRLDSQVFSILLGRASGIPIIKTVGKSMAGMMYVRLPIDKSIFDYKYKD